MSRYIDADKLYGILGIDGYDCQNCEKDARDCRYKQEYSLMEFCSIIEDAPTADVVEVVRCKDCKNAYSMGLSSNTNITFHNCHVHNTTVTGDYYCGDGERKEE